jgi:hypothetical protein
VGYDEGLAWLGTLEFRSCNKTTPGSEKKAAFVLVRWLELVMNIPFKNPIEIENVVPRQRARSKWIGTRPPRCSTVYSFLVWNSKCVSCCSYHAEIEHMFVILISTVIGAAPKLCENCR